MNRDGERLRNTPPAKRVLLLSHCLRPSLTCPGKFDKSGLHCPESCEEDCSVGRFAREAERLGYGGVCVAAGGKMAIKFVAEHRPQGIVAVACDRELEEGVEAVHAMVPGGVRTPAILAVPLSRDGCVDTEVDEGQVLEALRSGCSVDADKAIA